MIHSAAGLGEAIVDGGAPFDASVSVSGGATSGETGSTIIEAGSLADAVTTADGCPIFAAGGNVEVYETIAM